MNKRLQKRWKRENRPKKGAKTEAARQALNEEIRERRRYESRFSGDDAMLMGMMLPFMAGRR